MADLPDILDHIKGATELEQLATATVENIINGLSGQNFRLKQQAVEEAMAAKRLSILQGKGTDSSTAAPAAGTSTGGGSGDYMDITNGGALSVDQIGQLVGTDSKAKGKISQADYLSGLQQKIYDGAQKNSVNPLLVLSIGSHESNFGHAYDKKSSAFGSGHNMFGLDYSPKYKDDGANCTGYKEVFSGRSTHKAAQFDTWADSMIACMGLLHRNYFSENSLRGWNSADNKKRVALMIHKYSPASDGNNESGYVADILKNMEKWGKLVGADKNGAAGSTGGLDVYYYNQFRDEKGTPWRGMGTTGCGGTSCAMVSRFVTGNTNINPAYIYDKQGRNAFMLGTLNKLCSAAGVEYASKDCSGETAMRLAEDSIKKGYPAIIHAYPPYAHSLHIMVLVGFDKDGNVILNDPNNSNPKWHILNGQKGKNALADRKDLASKIYRIEYISKCPPSKSAK